MMEERRHASEKKTRRRCVLANRKDLDNIKKLRKEQRR
jgi:hypothetical protein